MGYSIIHDVSSSSNAHTPRQHTHLDIKPNRLRQHPEHLFQRRERRLYEVASAIRFEAFFLERPRMLHPFAHVGVLFFVREVYRH